MSMSQSPVFCVGDTSTLIRLRKGKVLECLQSLFSKVYLPQAVKDECRDPQTAAAIAQPFFVVKTVSQVLDIGGLHQGELEAISLAKELGINIVLLDDKAAIKKAIRHNLSPIGTFDVLVLAKRGGFIPSVKQAMDAMRSEREGITEVDYQRTMIDAGEKSSI